MPKRRLKGKIKHVSGSKTVAVEVERAFHHPRYRKKLKVSKSYLAHAQEPTLEVGQEVVIEETRPISKRKTWRVVEVEGKPVSTFKKSKSSKDKPKKKSGAKKKGAKK